MPKMSRAALLAMAFQQARKFAKTPRGQQLITQAKQAANDPQARARLIQQVKERAGRGGPSAGQPGVADPYPPATQPLASSGPASPGPLTGSPSPSGGYGTPSSPPPSSPPFSSPPPPPAGTSDPTIGMPPR